MPTNRPATKDPVTIDLGDGITRKLRYPFKFMREAKKALGVSMMNGEAVQKLDEDKFPELLYYGLKADEPSITVEYITEHMEASDIPYLLMRFMMAFTGKTEEEIEAEQEKAKKAAASQ